MTVDEPASTPPGPDTAGLAALFAHSSDALVVAEVEGGTVVGWNPAAERLFGYPRKVALGMAIERLVPKSIRRGHTAGFNRFRRTDRAESVDHPRPAYLTILRADGSEVDVQGKLCRLPSTDGSRYLLAIFHSSGSSVGASDPAVR